MGILTGQTVVNKGVNGWTTINLLQDFQTNVIDAHPEYVIIMGGTNDAWTSASLTAMQARWPQYNLDPSKAANGQPDEIFGRIVQMAETADALNIKPILVCEPGQVNEAEDTDVKLCVLWDKIRAYAAEKNFPLIDFYKVTRPGGPGTPFDESKLYPGDFHFNGSTYQEMGVIAAKVIDSIIKRM